MMWNDSKKIQSGCCGFVTRPLANRSGTEEITELVVDLRTPKK